MTYLQRGGMDELSLERNVKEVKKKTNLFGAMPSPSEGAGAGEGSRLVRISEQIGQVLRIFRMGAEG